MHESHMYTLNFNAMNSKSKATLGEFFSKRHCVLKGSTATKLKASTINKIK